MIVGAISAKVVQKFCSGPSSISPTTKAQRNGHAVKIFAMRKNEIREDIFAGRLLPTSVATKEEVEKALRLHFGEKIEPTNKRGAAYQAVPSGLCIRTEIVPCTLQPGKVVWSTLREGETAVEFWITDESVDISTFLKNIVRCKCKKPDQHNLLLYHAECRFEPLVHGCAEYGPDLSFMFTRHLCLSPPFRQKY